MPTALVIIDMQQGMFTEDVAPYRGEEVLQLCADLLDRARAARTPVFHVQHDGGAGDSLGKGSPGLPSETAWTSRETWFRARGPLSVQLSMTRVKTLSFRSSRTGR